VLLLVLLLAPPIAAYATAPRWLPEWPAVLDTDRPLDNPDVVVVKAGGENDDAVREAARLQKSGATKQVAVLGLPFTPDTLAPPPRNRRVEQLVAAGVPASAVVELRKGDDIYEEMGALRDAAAEHGWRRVLFFVDGLTGRRNLVVADRFLGLGGRVAVGQRTFPLTWFDADTWWRGGQPRTIVFVRTVQLAFAELGNRSS
jgi:hypothetical protein